MNIFFRKQLNLDLILVTFSINSIPIINVNTYIIYSQVILIKKPIIKTHIHLI